MVQSSRWTARAISGLVLAVLTASGGFVHAGSTPAEKCAIAKSKAATKKIAAKMKCWQKAMATGAPSADMACLMAAETKFDTAIQKAEAKGGCVSTGEEMRIESVADKCVSSIVSVTPTVTCQAATLTCHCGSITTNIIQACGAASPRDCTSVRNEAAQNCALNGQPTDDCQALSCTDACTGQPCGGGCPSPSADCGGFCVDTSTDRQNCGSCGHLCLPTEVCSSGSCVCQSPNALCGCATTCFCADLQTNPNNCGSCGHVCTSGVCSGGVCQ